MAENPYESPSLVKAEDDSLPSKRTQAQILLNPVNIVLPLALTLQFSSLMN